MKDEKYGVGTLHKTKNGEMFVILEKLGNKRKVKFLEDNFERVCSLSSIIYKHLTNTSNKELQKYGIGNIHTTNENCSIKIIEITSYRTRKIKFLDDYGYERVVGIPDILSGKIKNPYYTSIQGFGVVGENSSKNKSYRIWRTMISRVHSNNKQVQYSSISICDEWRFLDNFKAWFEKTYPTNIAIDYNIELDKDLLQLGIDSKLYSPSTCLWLPKRINLFLHNDYKTNTSGKTGVYLNKYNSYVAQGHDFDTSKTIRLGSFKTLQEASQAYEKHREEQAEKARQYLRDLNYLPEEIIQLVK